MFSQRFLRLPPALRATSHLRSASKPSPAPFLHQRPNPSFIRHYAYPPPGSPPPRRPPRVIHYRFDPNGASRAKPLITVEQVNNVVRSPRFLYICLFASGSAAVFYFMNLEEVPVSGRKRFNCYSEATVEKEGERMYRMIMAEAAQNRAIVPPSDRRSKMVARVLSRLVEAQGLQHVNWEVHVIESDEQNAFVIPGGKVFVYSGILPICRDDDGLAAVLGHEIAHNLAQHAAESMSSRIMLEPIRWALIFADSAGFTLGLGRYLGEIALNLGIAMPASRKQESEADYIGLMMMAKACYNPEAAVGLWERMEKAKEAEPPEWLSTHPSNANRIMNMEQWLAKAIDTRNESNCAATIGHARDFQSTFGDFGPFFGGVFR